MAYTIQNVSIEAVSLSDFEPTRSENCFINSSGDILVVMGPGYALLFQKAEPIKLVG